MADDSPESVPAHSFRRSLVRDDSPKAGARYQRFILSKIMASCDTRTAILVNPTGWRTGIGAVSTLAARKLCGGSSARQLQIPWWRDRLLFRRANRTNRGLDAGARSTRKLWRIAETFLGARSAADAWPVPLAMHPDWSLDTVNIKPATARPIVLRN